MGEYNCPSVWTENIYGGVPQILEQVQVVAVGGKWAYKCSEKRICVLMIGSSATNRTLEQYMGSMKISRRNPCSPFFSVSYSINGHKIL